MAYSFINSFTIKLGLENEWAVRDTSTHYVGEFLSRNDLNLLKVQSFAIIILFISNVMLILLLYFLFKGVKQSFRSHFRKIQYFTSAPSVGSNSLAEFVPLGEDKLGFRFDYDILTDQEKRKLAMLQMNLRADHKWNLFKKWFTEIYPDFYLKLLDRFPEMTQGDMRLLSLMNLNLANKDMSLRLGISVEGVKKSKQRLRKKLNIDLDELLEELHVKA